MTAPPDTAVTMQLPSGTPVPSQVHLPSLTIAQPDASGQISVPAKDVPAMLANGWQVVVDSGTTHVP